jgi:pantoate--beta-alanine ligase
MLTAARGSGLGIGLVPTMGALHPGHLSLIERAREECDVVAVSLFVNPLQFGPAEDFDAYPRDLEGDAEKAAQAGADCLFAPSAAEMFPDGPPATTVRVEALSSILEGAARPTHFEGVCTVVTKLLSLSGRCRAYFGEKDYQQLVIVRRLVSDLSIAAEIVACPIVREPDGLALSSRNARLTLAEREVAPILYRALAAGAEALSAGGDGETAMGSVLATEPLVDADYAVVRDAETLGEPREGSSMRLLVAARLGSVRLIDNLGVAGVETRSLS